jgi:hypothetical protein
MPCSEHRHDGCVTIVLVRSPRSCPMAPTCTTQQSSSTGKEMREKGFPVVDNDMPDVYEAILRRAATKAS